MRRNIQGKQLGFASEEVVRQLRVDLSSDIKKITAMGRARSRRYERFDLDLIKYYRQNKKKGPVTI